MPESPKSSIQNEIHSIAADRHQFVLHPDKSAGEKLSDSSRLLFGHSFACEASPVAFQVCAAVSELITTAPHPLTASYTYPT
jgi:hypothetical protein